jgi:nucleoside-diphosphate-sugar epimerase
MRVLITGGSGFIGTNLVEYYLSNGVEILNFDIVPPRNGMHSPYWRQVDIRNSDCVRAGFVDFHPSHIINLAAQTGTSDSGKSIEDFSANFHGLQNVLECARDAGFVERLVSASTMLVCAGGRQPHSDTDYSPNTLYGESKMLGEMVLRDAACHSFSWVIVRPTGIWGPWFDVPYKQFFKMIQRGLYLHPGKEEVLQTLGFVGNTCHQLDRLTKAANDDVAGKTFYLGDCPPVNMRQWADLIQEAFGARRIRVAPLGLLRCVARIGDLANLLGWEVPPLSSFRLKNMLTSFVFDLEPMLVEDVPFDLEQAVQATVGYLRTQESGARGE